MDHSKPNRKLFNLPWKFDEFNDMPYQLLGNSGLRVSKIGLGTWKFGYPETGDGARVDAKTAFQIFERAIELGVTFWDTANRYNACSGNAERLIGTWLKNNPDQRRNVVIATKVSGCMDGRTPNHCGLSRGNILDSVYSCLERLQVDYIDLLYFHNFDPFTPIQESLIAVEDLISKDLVRYFGVCNFSIEQLSLYQAIEKNMSIRCRVVAVQNQFDVLNGESQSYKGVLEYASCIGISFVAWSPLARGLLTNRYIDLSKIGPGDRLYDENSVEEVLIPPVMIKLKKLAELAHKWELSINQLSLAYMLSLPGMGPAIPASSTVQQLESNAAAGKIILNEGQKEQLHKSLNLPIF
jgi:aryl-alcohol dehydrogenase-like predicted oxidoreductase